MARSEQTIKRSEKVSGITLEIRTEKIDRLVKLYNESGWHLEQRAKSGIFTESVTFSRVEPPTARQTLRLFWKLKKVRIIGGLLVLLLPIPVLLIAYWGNMIKEANLEEARINASIAENAKSERKIILEKISVQLEQARLTPMISRVQVSKESPYYLQITLTNDYLYLQKHEQKQFKQILAVSIKKIYSPGVPFLLFDLLGNTL